MGEYVDFSQQTGNEKSKPATSMTRKLPYQHYVLVGGESEVVIIPDKKGNVSAFKTWMYELPNPTGKGKILEPIPKDGKPDWIKNVLIPKVPELIKKQFIYWITIVDLTKRTGSNGKEYKPMLKAVPLKQKGYDIASGKFQEYGSLAWMFFTWKRSGNNDPKACGDIWKAAPAARKKEIENIVERLKKSMVGDYNTVIPPEDLVAYKYTKHPIVQIDWEWYLTPKSVEELQDEYSVLLMAKKDSEPEKKEQNEVAGKSTQEFAEGNASVIPDDITECQEPPQDLPF